MIWTKEQEAFLREHYPHNGRDWCAAHMGVSTASIRAKASRMGLKAKGVSSAWREGQIKAAASKVGKKRPDQAIVMKALHAEGKLAMTNETKKKLSAAGKRWHAANPHPRGALGMKHKPETLERISAASIKAWARMSEDKREARTDKFLRTKAARGTYATNQPHGSWKAGWREFGGKRCYFRSRWEANYGRYLEWLKLRGEIIEWEHEPETFWFPVKRGVRSYLPDFRVTDKDGSVSYHEVKGWMDPKSVTKLKRMRVHHSNISVVLVDSKSYRQIKSVAGRMIEGWEEGSAPAQSP
jgi:hypothetical protein